MAPSPISVVRSLPGHLFSHLPVRAPRRTLGRGIQTHRGIATSPISRQVLGPTAVTPAEQQNEALLVSDSMTLDLPRDDPKRSEAARHAQLSAPRAAQGAEVASHVPQPGVDGAEASESALDRLMSGKLTAESTRVRRVKPPHNAKVASLRRSLHRVLFSPGVHFIRDPRTGYANFEPNLEAIPPPSDFAFHRCPAYITPSQDPSLAQLAQKIGCQFIGSTSSLTQALSQMYFAISGGKGIENSTISIDFQHDRTDFTTGASLPASLILRPLVNHPAVYAVDSDKSWDVDNVLSDFGRVLEKVLTSEEKDFARFLTSAPESGVSEKERTEREAYSYCRTGSMLMRSQLDCKDGRLPGSGVFDIKTRAVFPIRHDRANYSANSVYDVSTERGKGATFERELYDLARSGMLKYSMQVRIGGMDGVFCAYHNTKRLLGFQYLPLSEMDKRLFGSTEAGEMSFAYSVALLEIAFKYIAKKIPGQVSILLEQADFQALSVTVRQTTDKSNSVDVAFYPLSDPTARQGVRIHIDNIVDGEKQSGELTFDRPPRRDEWTAEYRLSPLEEKSVDKVIEATKKVLGSMATLSVPEGKTVEEMTTASAPQSNDAATNTQAKSPLQWKNPSGYIKAIRQDAKRNGQVYEARKLTWTVESVGGQLNRRRKVPPPAKAAVGPQSQAHTAAQN